MPTMLSDLVNPQVMADKISATLPKKIKVAPIANIDTTLVGVPGNTITVPKFAYIGDAEDVAEGVAMGTTKLTASTTSVTVKKAGKAIEITDEAALSGYGDPVGEGESQLTMAIAAKVDNDAMTALQHATLQYNGASAVIGYSAVVDAVDLFQDENDDAIAGVMYVHPNQVTTLRKDSNFLDVNKYPITDGVIMKGVIGQIAGMQVVKSKKVKEVIYEKDNASGTITIVADSTPEEATKKHLSTIMENAIDFTLAVNDKVKVLSDTYYANPIVIIDERDPNENPGADGNATNTPALTIYMKRAPLVEKDRDILAKTTVISADEHFAVALSNDSKVVLAKFKK